MMIIHKFQSLDLIDVCQDDVGMQYRYASICRIDQGTVYRCLWQWQGQNFWLGFWHILYNIYILVGGLDLFLFSIIYGMSSFALTNSYFSRWLKPPTSIYYVYVYYIPGRTDATAGRSCTNWWWKTRYLAMACNVHAQGRHCKSLKLVYGKCGHVKRGCLKFENIKILENILQSIDFSLSHIYIYIHLYIYIYVYIYI